MYSKCACCDNRNATIYNADADDMYCSDCHDEKIHHEEVCYCTEHMECMPCIERYKNN